MPDQHDACNTEEATGPLAGTGAGRTARKADTGAVFHPASRPTSSDASNRCWCEIVNGKRHVADGCPTHDVSDASIQVEHRLTIRATCPVDGTEDVYNTFVRVDRSHDMPTVEEIQRMIALATVDPIFQEELTLRLARGLAAEVETHGIHSGVYTTCRCSG